MIPIFGKDEKFFNFIKYIKLKLIASYWDRTNDLSVNSRVLYRLS